MISVDCDLSVEIDGDCFHLRHDPARARQLVLEIPSMAAGLRLARQISSPGLRMVLWSLQQPDWLEGTQLALRYRQTELLNQSLQSYARLETLWRLSQSWKQAFGL